MVATIFAGQYVFVNYKGKRRRGVVMERRDDASGHETTWRVKVLGGGKVDLPESQIDTE